ncbi:tRNA modification GTPase TrmE [Legionella gratiana]|uniref:tRNA modification GTPase TrmE n=1 Tax=Legionella gratiana TaxID=45066 RepID=A0ABR5R0Y9_9GAMM|nr:Rab family GTPase [Legionella gratiana]KTD09155.1 tRNA modification GTPase TrmE [Legionella gratiana]
MRDSQFLLDLPLLSNKCLELNFRNDATSNMESQSNLALILFFYNGIIKQIKEIAMSNDDYSAAVKVSIIGRENVGKTALSIRFKDNKFVNLPSSLLNDTLICKDLDVENKKLKIIIFNIKDTKIEKGNATSLRGSEAVIVVYDPTDKDSFLKAQCLCEKYKDTYSVYLVETKSDIPKDGRQVTLEEAQNFIKTRESISFCQVSAKTGENVDSLFKDIANKFLKKRPYLLTNNSTQQQITESLEKHPDLLTNNSTQQQITESLEKHPDLLTNNSTQQQITESLEKFRAKHKELYDKDMRSFSSLRHTKVDENWALHDCVLHAQKHDNRSRKAFIDLGWMHKDGSLTENAPRAVREVRISPSELSSAHTTNPIEQIANKYRKILDELKKAIANKDKANNEIPNDKPVYH